MNAWIAIGALVVVVIGLALIAVVIGAAKINRELDEWAKFAERREDGSQ